MNEFSTCFLCGRHPLVGEQTTLISNGARETAVCDLCLANPRVAALGEPTHRERVRSAEGEATVRRLIPEPVAAPPARVPRTHPIEA